MKRKTIISAMMAACLATSGFAFAQGKGDDRGRDDKGSHYGQQDRRDYDGRKGDDRGHYDKGNHYGQQDRRDYDGRQGDRHYDRGYHNERRSSRDGYGAGPGHNYYRGGYLPVQYRHRQYVVEDWRGHNLSAPPRGYHWVQTGSDYVLIAIASGIIASIFLNQY